MPAFGFDFLSIAKSLKVVRSLREGDEVLLKILVATVSTGKAVFAHTVDVKGPGEDRYAVQRLAEDICWLGYTRVLLRSDNEPAILKLLEESLKSLRVGVVAAEPPGGEEPSEEMRHYHKQVGQEHPSVYDSNANGEVENATRRPSGQLRTEAVPGEALAAESAYGSQGDELARWACCLDPYHKSVWSRWDNVLPSDQGQGVRQEDGRLRRDSAVQAPKQRPYPERRWTPGCKMVAWCHLRVQPYIPRVLGMVRKGTFDGSQHPSSSLGREMGRREAGRSGVVTP